MDELTSLALVNRSCSHFSSLFGILRMVPYATTAWPRLLEWVHEPVLFSLRSVLSCVKNNLFVELLLINFHFILVLALEFHLELPVCLVDGPSQGVELLTLRHLHIELMHRLAEG